MAGIFSEFFLISVSHEMKHENSSKNSGKIRSNIRGKIRDENSKKFGELSFCNFSGLNKQANTKTKFSRDCPGIIPGLSRDSPGLLLRFPGNFVYVFPFSPGKRETHRQFEPHPFPGQSRKVVYVYWFFFFSPNLAIVHFES